MALTMLPDITGEEYYNIFCDASIKTFEDGVTIGCAGAIGMHGNKKDMWRYQIVPATTNNNSEITAMFLAVELALVARQFYKNINVFSDSKICVFGIRHWYEGWLRNMDENGVLYGSNGAPVANQEIFKDVMRFVLQNELKFNLYHQKGHVTNTKESMANALSVFRVSNKMDISEQNLRYITKGNIEVDKTTKEHLKLINSSNGYRTPINRVFNSIVTYDDVPKYSRLVGGGKI